MPTVLGAIVQNAGQTCSAGSRLLVERSIYDDFVGETAKRFAKIKVGAWEAYLDCGPLISEIQRDRVRGFIETEPRENTGGAGRRAMGLFFAKAFVNIGNPFRVRRRFRFGLQFRQFRIGGQHRIHQRALPFRRFLTGDTDPPTRLDRNTAAIGFDLVHDQLQKRRFAGTVTPDQPNAMASRNRRRRLVQQHPGTDPVSKIFNLQHGARFDTARPGLQRRS